MAKKYIKPTESELEILRILWEKGSCTVSAVHKELGKDIVYTTTLKLMQIMHDKGLVSRDVSNRAHTYIAIVNRDITQKNLLKRMAYVLFSDSMGSVAMQAIGNGAVSKEELQQIKQLIAEKEKEMS